MPMLPFGVTADLHAHLWTVGSTHGPEGENSRLQGIARELLRAAKTVKAAGGKHLIIAGDVFHQRGKIDPEVLNVVRKTIGQILAIYDLTVLILPGNHDLKSRHTVALQSAVENLAQEASDTSGAHCKVFNKPETYKCADGRIFGFVPWTERLSLLMDGIDEVHAKMINRGCDPATQGHLFIHAGIDGVLSGVPGHGLTAAMLAKKGFRRVYAGHYHNHVVFPDGVVSIGSLTHQTWSDVGTRAGFLIVDQYDSVTFYDNREPKFVDLTGLTEEEMEIEARGNHVRYRAEGLSALDVKALKETLEGWGAVSVLIQVTPTTKPVVRQGITVEAGKPIEAIVTAFVEGTPSIPAEVDRTRVETSAQRILAQARAAHS